jgi:gliding motility-associated-like protein
MICDSSSVFFNIQTSDATAIYWEVYSDSGWTYLNDNRNYSGAHSEHLVITNADTSMNAFEYRCYVEGTTCPEYSSAAVLAALPLPIPVLTVNTSTPQVCNGNSVTIGTRQNYVTYLWSDNSSNNTITVNQPGEYWVEVTDAYNCKGIDSINILPCSEFYIPDAFTPNNDGKNDTFMPIITGNVTDYRFRVFNQWGQLVFQSSDAGKGWNGTFNVISQPVGVFVWDCRYEFPGTKEEYKRGMAVLVR